MASAALRAVLVGATQYLDRVDLLAFAEAALGNTDITGTPRNIWSFVAFALNPLGHADRFTAEHDGQDIGELFDEDLGEELVQAIETVAGEYRQHCDTIIVRFLGKLAAPE